ncbi:rRNA maturation RNase YbeY [Candidatus Gottesmanbacteria bacterium]|nr:rRNA maturation RNase YbeY [Candidatus Gottesmanbacteria bacterium]
MVKVLISSESRFPINRKSIKSVVETFLNEQKIKSEVEVSISIVGDRKMRELNKKYRNLEETTPVLSFSLDEGKPFVNPPDEVLRLGDIVISYPQTVAMAAAENKLIDQKISELVRHGLSNLLGISH